MRIRWFGVSSGVLGVALVAAGCSDGDPKPPPDPSEGRGGSAAMPAAGTGGGGTTGGTTVAATGGSTPACNTLTLDDVPPWSLTYDASEAPAAVGGTITDGTYVLTKEVAYESEPLLPSIPLARSKLEISGANWHEVEGGPDADDLDRRHRTSTRASTGTSLTITRTCPSLDETTFDFSATADAFTLYFTDRTTRIGAFFEKQ